jgi:hypothetical protein
MSDAWGWSRDPIEESGTPPPPCELPYPRGQTHLHPRFPSGDCVVCGALCTEGCKHVLAVGEWAPAEG